jgi:hypothetical protein
VPEDVVPLATNETNPVNSTKTDVEVDDEVEWTIVADKNLTEITAKDTLEHSGLLKIDLNKTSAVELKSEFCKEVGAIAQRYQILFKSI